MKSSITISKNGHRIRAKGAAAQALFDAMTNPIRQQEMVEAWNKQHPVGTPVVVVLDDGSTKQTKTKSEAWLLGEHTAVVLLEGISGGYQLSRVSAN